ncbi:hypothetical protein [Devosia sp.]|uniref:hypothetical protein n=1 Tax=Devosia sp. TaxID=1871048 RepID=UPI002635A223|nr:hypothetical protein [Devosia sp.]
MTLAMLAGTAAAAPLQAGDQFRLDTGRATVKLHHVEVNRVTSDNTIDLVTVLSAPVPTPASQEDMFVQLAEFCLRYQDDIVKAAVPRNEHSKMNLFVPLFQVSGQQVGFAFQVAKGKCTLEAPFPSKLAAEARKHAKAALH